MYNTEQLFLYITYNKLPTPILWQRTERPPTELLTHEPLVFRLNLAEHQAIVPQAEEYVSADEKKRAATYYQIRHARRFLIGRSTMRLLLGILLDVLPREIFLIKNPSNKLFVYNKKDVFINISYADSWLLIGIAPHEVGADIELVNTEFLYEDIVTSYFSDAERSYISSCDNPSFRFFELWTRKEAIAKALGTGIDENFHRLLALDGTHQLPQARGLGEDKWQVCSFMVDAQHIAAVAYPAALFGVVPQFYHVSPQWYC